MSNGSFPHSRAELLVCFCRLQFPLIGLPPGKGEHHLLRTFDLHRAKADPNIDWDRYLDRLYPLDWFVASACLEGDVRAWDVLFASRAGRTDVMLLDALRARAVRLYPRDDERQDEAVQEFWGMLFAAERPGSLPILARYDGQRPLVPWLIRVFQNWHVSQLRKHSGTHALPEDDIALPLPTQQTDDRWRDVFSSSVREWIETLTEDEALLLGLRLRHRLSQREVATLLQVHEGTMSRRTDQLRERCLEHLQKRLLEAGWVGDDLFELVRGEMLHLLLDDPRLSADNLARILSSRGKQMPAATQAG
ncbi:MAG: sigma-70 family RNA polymerase sigma factor [Gemmataceae bacterium]|nr:sigma-70 family RNA polymerase sigma factor [Gemmataceae bacterium]